MQILVNTIRVTTVASLPTVFLTMTIAQPPAIAGPIGSCVNHLIDSGIVKEQAAAACSDVIQPTELSACVEDITAETDIKALDVLQACYRVRRPQELANCTLDISTSLGESQPVEALDNCRRSLLPTRYAECTLDLQAAAGLSSTKAMETCITAEFFPSTLAPTTPQK
ncbi:MAG: hypothetical protein ACFCU5_13285 [Pleurocapsa sp.]